jgi:tetratricopeptide (TPR) repeat protein
MGTSAVIWAVALILAAMGILMGVRYHLPRFWAPILILLAFAGLSNQSWAVMVGEALYLRERVPANIVYEADSQYSHIRVEEIPGEANVRSLVLDRLSHSKVYLDDPARIDGRYQYGYIRLLGELTRQFAKGSDSLEALCIGGGGYVLPQYLAKNWPASRIEVVEIDPEVTRTAKRFLAMPEDVPLNIHHLDARNYVEGMTFSKKEGKETPEFDVIYSDTANDLSAPFQLTTYEFNEKLKEVLKPDGVYMLNLIDSFTSGKALGAFINTLRKSFDHVRVFSAGRLRNGENEWNTFILAASRKEMSLGEISSGYQLSDSEKEMMEGRAEGIVLTDDYAPVENLLKKVAYGSGLRSICSKLINRGNKELSGGNKEEAVRWYEKALAVNPSYAEAFVNIGAVRARQNRLDEAVTSYKKALEIDPDLVEASFGVANIYAMKSDNRSAIRHYADAIKTDPDFAPAYNNLGEVLIREGRIEGAIVCFDEALKIDPGLEKAASNMNAAVSLRKNYPAGDTTGGKGRYTSQISEQDTGTGEK